MRCLLFLLAAASACGRPFLFGLKGGGSAAGGLDPAADDRWEGKRYTLGVTAEIGLSFHFAGEVDALYKRAGRRGGGCFITFCSASGFRANIFEFPLLLKYRLAPGVVAPFVSGGLAVQWVRHGNGLFTSWRTGPIVPGEVVDYAIHKSSSPAAAENRVGAVAAAGVEFRSHRFKLTPEFRYTRWNSRYWESFGSRGFFTGSNLNQVDILLGVTF